MRRLTFIATLVAALAASLSLVAPAGAVTLRRCSTRKYANGFRFLYSRAYIRGLAVHHMTCGQAIYDLHHGYLVGWPPHLRVANFHCHVLSSGKRGVTESCVRRRVHKSFRVTVSEHKR